MSWTGLRGSVGSGLFGALFGTLFGVQVGGGIYINSSPFVFAHFHLHHSQFPHVVLNSSSSTLCSSTFLKSEYTLSGPLHHRQWSTSSSAPTRTEPSSSNPTSSTVYSQTNCLTPFPHIASHLTHATLLILRSSMSVEASLYSITRSKLYESVSSKDQCSLHRWVLLKNSILSTSTQSDIMVSEYSELTPNSNEESEEEEELAEEEIGSVAIDSFMFPDARNFVSDQVSHNSEAEWLDSLLETLAEDDDDDFPSDSEIHTTLPVDEDDDQLLSPSVSPLASSEDLPQSRFFTSLPVPYPNNFSTFHSSSRNYVSTSFNNPTSSFSPITEDPLPYHDHDDIEDSSVPDAIEDLSDDESDTLSTPSFGRSINSLFLDTSASPSSPIDRHPLSFKHPSHPKPLHLDPLPFADEWSHHAFYSTD